MYLFKDNKNKYNIYNIGEKINILIFINKCSSKNYIYL